LNDVEFTAADARRHFHTLLREVVRMLCAGIVHGDLSEFNILLGSEGPVIIDLPQAVDAAGNNYASSMLERDVGNLAAYFGRFAPELLTTQYGKEIWSLYARGDLHPDVELTGTFKQDTKPVDLKSVIRVIDDVRAEEAARQLRKTEVQGPLD
ncbi:MAG: RIO1 family regulatory kinase/ATPase domain-containing protein, partial [Methylotenera sp.]